MWKLEFFHSKHKFAHPYTCTSNRKYDWIHEHKNLTNSLKKKPIQSLSNAILRKQETKNLKLLKIFYTQNSSTNKHLIHVHIHVTTGSKPCNFSLKYFHMIHVHMCDLIFNVKLS